MCGYPTAFFAPTLRCHDGTYYLITTNISDGGNFIVTAPTRRAPGRNYAGCLTHGSRSAGAAHCLQYYEQNGKNACVAKEIDLRQYRTIPA